MITEHLKSEKRDKQPGNAVLLYLISLLCLVILFSLFLSFGAGGEQGIGGGNATGEGSGTGSGTGAGLGQLGGVQGKHSNSSGVLLNKVHEQKLEPHKKIDVISTSQQPVAKLPQKNQEKLKKQGNLRYQKEKNFSPFSVKMIQKVPSTRPATALPSMQSGHTGSGSSAGKTPGTGDISFRIYWIPRIHDIDLHVIDPNGHELFFQNKMCPCHGELDVDDTHSGGPENIFWPPGKAPHGEYLFYVVYYDGVGPKNVILEVRKGKKIFKTYRIRLTHKNEKSKTFRLSFE